MDFEIYCDESRQELFRTERATEGKYVLIGGIWIEASKRAHFKGLIKQFRDHYDVWGEFKWNRVSSSRLDFYLDLVRLFFREDMRFRCILLARDEMDALRFHHADEELMFYKFYYQLLHPWILDLNRYRIFLDLKTNRVPDRLRTLKKASTMHSLLQAAEVPPKRINSTRVEQSESTGLNSCLKSQQ